MIYQNKAEYTSRQGLTCLLIPLVVSSLSHVDPNKIATVAAWLMAHGPETKHCSGNGGNVAVTCLNMLWNSLK